MARVLPFVLLAYFCAINAVAANALAARLKRRGWHLLPAVAVIMLVSAGGPALLGLTLGVNGVHFFGGAS